MVNPPHHVNGPVVLRDLPPREPIGEDAVERFHLRAGPCVDIALIPHAAPAVEGCGFERDIRRFRRKPRRARRLDPIGNAVKPRRAAFPDGRVQIRDLHIGRDVDREERLAPALLLVRLDHGDCRANGTARIVRRYQCRFPLRFASQRKFS